MMKTILLICVCAQFGCSGNIEYEIKDAGISAMRGSIYWLDNEQVVFVNVDYRHIKSIYVWDELTGELKMHRSNVDSNICFNDGYITYRSRNEGEKIFHRSGMFPNEEEYPADLIDEKSGFNKYSCKRFIPPLTHKDNHIHYLKEGHGYLFIGSATGKNNNYIQYTKGDDSNIQLSIKGIDYRHPNGFYTFNNAYFLWAVRGANSTWDNKCQAAWWLYPDGKTETMCMPLVDGVVNGSVLVYPFKHGYLFVSHGRGGRRDAGNAGVYIFNKKLELKGKPISGHADGFAISQDGCKAAYRLNPLDDKEIRLTSINLCSHQ